MPRTIVTLIALALLASGTFAQPATPAQRAGVQPSEEYGTMHFQTKLGSYKIIDGTGRVEMDFAGTVMISGLKGTYTIGGPVRKEYDKYGRVIYTGRGHLVVTGFWRGLQWFGKDMKAVWYGKGMIRISGEFDREQKTGDYWFDDPERIAYWPGGSSIDVPMPFRTQGSNPNVHIKRKGGKG